MIAGPDAFRDPDPNTDAASQAGAINGLRIVGSTERHLILLFTPALSGFAQRYVSDAGVRGGLDLLPCFAGQLTRSLNRLAGLDRNTGIPNTVHELNFPCFSWDIGLTSGRSQFLRSKPS
jgi:hypothetical protein